MNILAFTVDETEPCKVLAIRCHLIRYDIQWDIINLMSICTETVVWRLIKFYVIDQKIRHES